VYGIIPEREKRISDKAHKCIFHFLSEHGLKGGF
jgi:hypothetical protein